MATAIAGRRVRPIAQRRPIRNPRPRRPAEVTEAPVRTIVQSTTRKTWRQSYGDLTSLVAAARDELEAGQLENAYTAYRLALGSYLRQRWLEQSGKLNSSLTEPSTLAQKLNSAGQLDFWTLNVVRLTEKRPKLINWTHVDVIAALVESLTLEGQPCHG